MELQLLKALKEEVVDEVDPIDTEMNLSTNQINPNFVGHEGNQRNIII